jgi:hypothetical protein
VAGAPGLDGDDVHSQTRNRPAAERDGPLAETGGRHRLKEISPAREEDRENRALGTHIAPKGAELAISFFRG